MSREYHQLFLRTSQPLSAVGTLTSTSGQLSSLCRNWNECHHLSLSKATLRNPVARMVYVIQDQWFLFSRGHLVALLPLGGTGDILVVTLGKEGKTLLASSGRRPRMLLSALQRTGQPLTMKNEPMSTVLWFKKASSRGQEFQPRKFKFQKSISYCRHQKHPDWEDKS